VFLEAERNANAAVAIVSERAARELWPGLDAVGQVLRLDADPKADPPEPDDPPLLSRSVIVIGVARDVPGFSLGGVSMTGAGVYMPIGVEAGKTSLVMRVRGESAHARRVLIDRLTAIDPNLADVFTLQTIAGAAAYLLEIPFWITLVLGALALLLTLSGLFSVLSYLVEKRTREIGVRMALGATYQSIAALILAQTARPVGVGLCLGVGLTAALGGALLATPAAAEIGSTVRIFDPAAYAASLLCIVAACTGAALIPALRAGRIDPVGALKQD
jgi:hypothetical protein